MGALAIAAACGTAGAVSAATFRRKTALLRETERFLHILEAEISQHGTPLPELFSAQAEQTELLRDALLLAAQKMRTGVPCREAAQQVISLLEGEALKEAAAQLDALFAVLGRYDACSQAAACGQAIQNISSLRRAAEEEEKKKGSLYRKVAWGLGAVFALALL